MQSLLGRGGPASAVGSVNEATSLSGHMPLRRKSGCTDLPILLFVFVPTCCALFLVALSSLRSGNLDRLIHGTDFAGNICGVVRGDQGSGLGVLRLMRAFQDRPVVNRPYAYYPLGFDGDTVRSAARRRVVCDRGASRSHMGPSRLARR